IPALCSLCAFVAIHSSGMPQCPEAISRRLVSASTGSAPCSSSHLISFRPLRDCPLVLARGSGDNFKGRLVLQIVTDIVFIVHFKVSDGPLQGGFKILPQIPFLGQEAVPAPKP